MRTLLSLAAAAAASTLVLLTAASSPSEAAAPAPAARPAAGTFAIDTGHSNILFRCKHLGVAYQWGRFDKFEGSFTLAEKAEESNVQITVDAMSVNSNSKGRDDHLRGPDFFDAKQHPDMTFQSTKVAAKGENTFTITGDLTLRGKTKSITFDVEKIGEADTRMGRRAGFEGSFVVDRMEFGVDAYGDTLGHDVTMTFAIEGKQG